MNTTVSTRNLIAEITHPSANPIRDGISFADQIIRLTAIAGMLSNSALTTATEIIKHAKIGAEPEEVVFLDATLALLKGHAE